MACTRVAGMAFTEGGRARSRRVSRVDCVEIGAAPWRPHMQPSSPVNVSNHLSYVGRRPPRKISGRESSSWPRMGVSCHLHALDRVGAKRRAWGGGMPLHQRPRHAGPAAGAGWASLGDCDRGRGPWERWRPPAGSAILTRKWPTLFRLDHLPLRHVG